MVRKAQAVGTTPSSGPLRLSVRQHLFRMADVGAVVFKAQLQLITIATLGTPAELDMLQLLNEQPPALDLGRGFGVDPVVSPIRRKITDQEMVRRARVVRWCSQMGRLAVDGLVTRFAAQDDDRARAAPRERLAQLT